jgi:hypothetical protein
MAWSWWQEPESDPFTAYVFGLFRARQAGITINQDASANIVS